MGYLVLGKTASSLCLLFYAYFIWAIFNRRHSSLRPSLYSVSYAKSVHSVSHGYC